jgi:hypothetical protein
MNNNNMNDTNNMNMNMNNMNDMNFMNNMNNMMNNLDDDIIGIFFVYNGNIQKIKCLNDELVSSIINRYCNNNHLIQDSLSFYFHEQTLPKNLIASDVGLVNLSTIEVEDKFNQNFNEPFNNNNFNFINNLNNLNLNSDNFNLSNDNFNNNNNYDEKKINLIFNYKGKKEVIFLGENSFVGDGLRAFLEKKNIDEEDYDNYTFIYDDKNLFLDDERKLKDVFFGVHAQINVIGE